MEETYGHTSSKKAFDQRDVYGVGYDPARAIRRPLRLGIIGAGAVAQSKHLPAISRLRILWEPVEVTALASLDEQQGRKIAGVFGGRWYGDAVEMLDREPLDGVLVASSDTLHAAHAQACLERGLPVLVEKPISRSLVDAQRICALADRLGLVLMTVSNKRYSPPYVKARRLIQAGPVACPALFAGKFNLGYDYVDLLEAGTVHLFDLARYLMGDVSAVRCLGGNFYHRSTVNYPIDNCIATLEFASGAVGTLLTSSTALSFKPWERVEVYGDHAWLEVDDQCRLTLYDSETGPAKSWTPVVPNTLFFDEEFGGFMGLIANFLQVIRGEEQPLVTGWDGYRALELLVACELSLYRGGEVIRLPLDPAAADVEAQAWLAQSRPPETPKEF